MPRSTLETLEESFWALCRGPAPLALNGRRLPDGLPRRSVRLTELRELLLWPGRVPVEAREAAWSELARRAQSWGPAWLVGAAGMALPGLRRMHAKLTYRYAGDAADLEAEMVAAFCDRLRRIDPDCGRLPARLCWAAYRAGLRCKQADSRYADLRGRTIESVESTAPPVQFGHPDMLLAHAVTGGLITAEEAELIGRTRMEDVTLLQVADELGVSRSAVKMRRHRAERRLAEAVRRGDLTRFGYERPAD